jgi:hypothetical protein
MLNHSNIKWNNCLEKFYKKNKKGSSRILNETFSTIIFVRFLDQVWMLSNKIYSHFFFGWLVFSVLFWGWGDKSHFIHFNLFVPKYSKYSSSFSPQNTNSCLHLTYGRYVCRILDNTENSKEEMKRWEVKCNYSQWLTLLYTQNQPES